MQGSTEVSEFEQQSRRSSTSSSITLVSEDDEPGHLKNVKETSDATTTVVDDIEKDAADPCTITDALSTANKENDEARLDKPYTNLSRRYRLFLFTPLLGLATTISPLTATIYFPFLPLLRTRFAVSAQSINLTLTIYIIFQAISPAVFGPLSDSLGRRPVYLITFGIYYATNLGLALLASSTNSDGSGTNHDAKFAGLLILRAFQSLGTSAAQSISYGVVADVCVSCERGKMIGPMSMVLTLATVIGPLTGGIIAWGDNGDVVWVFWGLFIFGLLLLLGVWALLPETARSVVGDGSGRTSLKWWERSGIELIRRETHSSTAAVDQEKQNIPPEKTISNKPSFAQRLKVGNPLACIRVLLHKDTALVLWLHGSFYVVDYAMVAVLPDIYRENYHYNELQVGLAYLPRGLGIVMGGYIVGRMLDYNYRYTARKAGLSINKVSGDDLEQFPIERARSRGTFVLLAISTVTLIGYGWATQLRHVHAAVPLILQVSHGLWVTNYFTTYQTLIVDVYPQSPSTAAGAASFMRCAMAAIGVAILQPMLDVMGRGWYFTALSLWSGIFGVFAVVVLRWKGMKWRQARMRQIKEQETS